MNLIETINQYSGLLTSLGVVAAAAGFLVVYAKKGGNTASSEAITTYKAAVDAYELRLKQTTDENQTLQKEITLMKERHRVEIEGLHQDVEKMKLLIAEQEKKFQVVLAEKDKQLEAMTKILQNRNPESETVTQAAAKFMQEKGVQIDAIYQAVVVKTP